MVAHTFSQFVQRIVWLLLVAAFVQVVLPATAQNDDPQGQPNLRVELVVPDYSLVWNAEDKLTVIVTNDGDGSAENVYLQLPRERAILYQDVVVTPPAAAEEGLEPATTPTALFLGNLSPKQAVTVTVTFQVRGVPRDGLIGIEAHAQGVGTSSVETKAQLLVTGFEPEEAAVLPIGGELAADNNRVVFVFPPGWNEKEANVTLSLQEQFQLLPAEPGTLLTFSVEAEDAADATPIENFDVPVAVTVQLADLLPASQEGAGEKGSGGAEEQGSSLQSLVSQSPHLLLVTREKPDEPWQEVEATYDPATGVLIFKAEHFSEFQLASEPEPWQFSYTPPGAAPYTGAGTYAYPLALPPGIGGMAPALSLSYNSRGVDGMRFPVMASGFGLGWSAPQAEIVNGNASRMYEDGSSCCHNYDLNRFTLVLDGTSYRLQPLSVIGRYGRYQAIGGPELYIEYVQDDNGVNNTDNVTGEFWRVRTAAGTRYTLGIATGAEQVVAPMSLTHNAAQPRNDRFAAVSWKLNSVVDVNGRQVIYTYSSTTIECGTHFIQSQGDRTWGLDGGGSQCTEVDTAVDKIYYNYNGAAHQTEIDFNYDLFNAEPDRQERLMTIGRFRPKEVIIKQGGAMIAKYTFGYTALGEHWVSSWDTSTQFWMLASITRLGANGSTTLPVEQFSYNQLADGCGEDQANDTHCSALLTLANNGYGGVTQLAYYPPEAGRWFHVSDVYLWDGVEKQYGASGTPGRPQTRLNYSRTGATRCYDAAGSGCHMGPTPPSDALVGFNKAEIKTQKPTGSSNWMTLGQEKLEFRIDDYWLNGKMSKQEQIDPANSNVLTRETLTWTQFGGDAQLIERHVELVSGANTLSNKTVYIYQNGTNQYGAVDEVREYDHGAGTPRRCTKNIYAHRTDVWLINRPLRETTYQGACTGTRVAETLYRYTGSANPNDVALDAKGQVEWVLRWDGNEYVTEQRLYYTGTQSVGLLKDTVTFSNRSTTSAYPSLTDDWRNKVRLTYDALGLVTQVQTIPKGGPLFSETMTYNATFPWLVKSVSDTNGVQTQYDYDLFGRLAKVASPGDTLNSPTMWYSYYDNGATQYLSPFLVGTFYKGAIQQDERRFYDGFGRLVQEQRKRYEVEGVGEQDILVTYGYDARGLPVCQTVPYAVAPYGGSGTPYKADTCTSKAHTAQAYDAASRPSIVTAPDGSETSYQYSVKTTIFSFGYSRLWQTQTFDGNKHVVNRFSNGFGELVLVRENSGDNPYAQYADTRYEYDAVGNLIKVLTSEPSDNEPGSGLHLRQITMSYDRLGRKTEMIDPDMGTWSYVYNEAGNMSRQVDGRERPLCFYYDDYNRLLRKTEDSTPDTICPGQTQAPTSGPYHLSTYSYDTAANGDGKLAQVKWGDDPNNNLETFTYDGEGRLKDHTREINGRPYTMSTTSYDTLDRPLTIAYPGNEDLLLTYDNEGVNTLAFQIGTTTTNLVTYLGFNARGQLLSIQRAGAAPDTGYTYHPAGENFRLERIQHGTTSDTFPDYSYNNYDAVGSLLSMTVDHNGTTGDVLHTYTYDDLNRLKTAKAQVGTAPAQYNYTYSYDELGNIDERTGTGGTWDYLYHGTIKQRLQQVTGYALHTTVYDGSGNLTSYKIGSTQHTLVYDAENRLASVTVGGQTTTFYYDASGQRVRTTYPNSTNVYTPFAEFDETVPSTGTATQRSSYFLNGQLVAVRTITGSSVAHYFTFADHLGNVSSMSTSGGIYVNNSYAQYKPFGAYQTEPTTNPGLTDRGFTGHQHNNTGAYDLGLVYMNARYYLPDVGRFISADTIVPDPSNPQSYNRYSYVRNQPLRMTDPSGHRECDGMGNCVSPVQLPSRPRRTAPRSPSGGGVGKAAADIMNLFATTAPRVAPPPLSSGGRVVDQTGWLVGQMQSAANSAVVQNMKLEWLIGGFLTQLRPTGTEGRALQALVLAEWASLVAPGAIWDFKVDLKRVGAMFNPDGAGGDKDFLQLGNNALNYQAVANVFYGYIGTEIGMSAELLLAGAGAAQLQFGIDHVVANFQVYPQGFGDQPFDAWSVEFGIYLHNQSGQLTVESFTTALDEFIQLRPIPTNP